MPSRAVVRFRRFAIWRFIPLRNREAAMGFSIGQWELLVIGVVIVLLFGHRLPGVMHSIGQGIRTFQEGFRGEDSSPSSDSSIHK
jgi:sec-independent protein translocase protein TatA